MPQRQQAMTRPAAITAGGCAAVAAARSNSGCRLGIGPDLSRRGLGRDIRGYGDKPVIACDHIAAEGAIYVQQAAQFFRVELLTQRGRTHQVAEHHG